MSCGWAAPPRGSATRAPGTLASGGAPTGGRRQEGLVHHREPMAAREAELADLVAARRSDIERYQERLTRQARESEDAEARISGHASELELAEQNAATLSEQRSTRLATVTEQEGRLRGLRDSLND